MMMILIQESLDLTNMLTATYCWSSIEIISHIHNENEKETIGISYKELLSTNDKNQKENTALKNVPSIKQERQ